MATLGQPTAYAQALARVQAGDTEEEAISSSIPSYMVASDTLSIANGNKTFLESTVDTIESIPKFMAASLISGANQLYNIPADVGNLFGGDFERSNTADVISGLDSNLGAFYEEHQEGADLVGFMLSSAVPGLGGIKILNAGQKSLRTAISAGKFGENTGKALGLLAPSKSSNLAKAIREASIGGSPAGLLNRNALKAVGAGIGQNALEALAFETAVTATLFKSPILENQDFGDFLTNVAWGAGVFGLVGGAVDAAKISSKLNRAVDAAAIEARPWTHVPAPATGSQSYEKIVLDYDTLNNIPPIPTNVGSERQAFLQSAADSTRRTVETRIRTELGTLTGGDQAVAQVLFDSAKAAGFRNQETALSGLVDASKLNVSSKIGDKAARLEAKVSLGKASIKEIDEFAESSISTTYVRTWGDNAGPVMTERPTITSLVDTLKKGERLEVTDSGVSIISGIGRKVTKHPFNTKANKVAKGKGKAHKHWDVNNSTVMEANARYIWAAKLKPFVPSASNKVLIHIDDTPLFEKVLRENSIEELEHVVLQGLPEGRKVNPIQMFELLYERKLAVANNLLKRKDVPAGLLRKGQSSLNQEQIAAIVNVKNSALSGELVKDAVSTYSARDMYAMQDYADQYTKKMVDQGSRKPTDGVVDIWQVPQTVKLTYDTKPFEAMDNHIVENIVIIKEQQKVYQAGVDRATMDALGAKNFAKLEPIDSQRVMTGAKPSGAGASALAAADGNYGSLSSTVNNIGKQVAGMIEDARESITDTLTPLLYKLGNNQAAAVEWSTLNSRLRSIEGNYALNKAGTALEPVEMIRWKAAAEEAIALGKKPPKQPILDAGREAVIEMQSKEVRDLAVAHIQTNGVRTGKLAGIRTSQGMQFQRDPDVFYPIPIDPKDYPHFALVIDESITSGNHTKTLYASSEKELADMAAKIKQNPQFKVMFKQEAEDYYKSIGQYDYEKTINNNYIDVEAHRKGVSAPFIVATDPTKITTDMLKWHTQRESGLVREAVSAKYEIAFAELESLGREATLAGRSTFSNMSIANRVEDVVKNPFMDYIKTALAIKKTGDYPFWTKVNQMADARLSAMYNKITDVAERAKSADDMAAVNGILEKAGYKGAQYDETMEIFANATPDRGVLNGLVQKANSVLATVILRWDVLNGVNNAVSANVLLGAETKAVIRAIGRGDSEAAGALAELTRVAVPGTDQTIFSGTKLVANAIKKFNAFDSASSPNFNFYKENGFFTSISKQYKDTLEDLTFNPAIGVKSWSNKIDNAFTKMKNAGDIGERFTGNKLAEEFNRFVAADVMKQMTDVAVSRKLMSAKEQLAYINTFVNRTQGNYLASQRPLMFSGAIGQAIGLFQTYQFNLMQQLLRHVGEGHGKDAMTLLALQGTIHGMNGMPGFNAINTHLVGNASGNKDHRDVYDATYGIAGKQAGDWLMYGAASNALGLLHPDLKVNLYTRGDINPRHVTIIPTNPADVAGIAATGKVFANIFNTAKKLGAGGDVVTTLLQGLEHNGISRPLAGLAQTLEGLDNPLGASYSTSKRGNVIASNDLLSLANLGRIVGGKPLDEAIAIDASYRFKAYGLKDQKKRQVLGAAIKTTLIAGKNPTQEQIEGFAEEYAAFGGRQEQFNTWFGQLYKTANLSQTNAIQQSLTSPFTQSMQKIMGGNELRDFTDD